MELKPLLIALGVVAFFGIIIWAVAADVKRKRRKGAYLRSVGFTDCPEKEQELTRIAKHLVCGDERDDKWYSVSYPKRVSSGGENVYYFYFTETWGSGKSQSSNRWEMFLFPFERKTESAVAVYLAPKKMNPVWKKVLGFAMSMAQGRNMRDLEIPRELQGSKVLALFGPEETEETLYDLMDSTTLSVLLEGMDFGVGGFCARGKLAAISLYPTAALKPETLNRLWPFVQRVARMK